MKYSIFINQLAISKTKLDLKDAAILDYIVSFYLSNNLNVDQIDIDERGKRYKYIWINYKHLLQEMPLLQFKSIASITPRIKKLEKEGFIKTKIIKSDTYGGKKLYIRLEPKIQDLFFVSDTSFNRMNELIQSAEQPHSFSRINNNIQDNNIQDNNIPYREGEPSSYEFNNKLFYLFKQVFGYSPSDGDKDRVKYPRLIRQKYPNIDFIEKALKWAWNLHSKDGVYYWRQNKVTLAKLYHKILPAYQSLIEERVNLHKLAELKSAIGQMPENIKKVGFEEWVQ